MNWLVICGASAIAAGAAGCIWAFTRLRDQGRISDLEDVAQAVEGALTGFSVRSAVMGSDGLAALAYSASGRVAAVRPDRNGFTIGEIVWANLRRGAHGILIETGSRRIGTLTLRDVDALDIRRLCTTRPGRGAALSGGPLRSA